MRVEDWGLIPYESAVEKQLQYVDALASGSAEDCLVLCTHPPVVTLGRAATADDLIGWQGPTIESSRGGRATFHGPNQVVLYPIIDLRPRGRDIHAYLRLLETATVAALKKMGLKDVEARTTKQGEISLTGVWIGAHKIASMGIAVRKWITYHGVAVNILEDALAFSGIRPCGFAPGTMTSVARELRAEFPLNEAKELLRAEFIQTLDNDRAIRRDAAHGFTVGKDGR